MVPSLLYLGFCLGPYFILGTASSGGVYMCSCCNYCGVAGAAIRVASSAVIRTTYSAAVGIAGGISGAVYGGSCGGSCGGSRGDSCRGCCWWVGILFTDLACCAGCLGAVGVREYVLALKWDGACADGACADRACADGACADGACTDGACLDGACPGRACTDGACADGACTDGACLDGACPGGACIDGGGACRGA